MGRHKALRARLSGLTYGLLKVGAFSGRDKKGYALWRCRCDCGREVVVSGRVLRRGDKKSCGIGHRYKNPARRTHDALTYSSWRNMLKRCKRQKHRDFANYGGRGITFDPKWKSYQAFVSDMGSRPSRDHSLDRVDTNGNYVKENCRWATHSEQNRNRRDNVFVTYNGKRMLLIELTEELGLSRSIVANRLKLGWPLREALACPAIRTGRRGRAKLDE